jgi:hypothetical protein
MNKLLMMLAAILMSGVSFSQELSPEMRAKFVKEQDAYLKKLNLDIDQNKRYKITTIKYDKMVMKVERSTLNRRSKKKRLKTIEKAKNVEMRGILNDWQYKQYLIRQQEIASNYKE